MNKLKVLTGTVPMSSLMCLIVDKDVGVNDNDNEYQQ